MKALVKIIQEGKKDEPVKTGHRKMQWNNRTGMNGVCFCEHYKKYVVKKMINKKSIYLGYYKERWDAFCRMKSFLNTI